MTRESLYICVWGDKKTKKCPVKVEWNCNAKQVSNKPGFSLRDVDGRDKIIQTHIKSSPNYESFMNALRTKVYEQHMRSIGINCSQGRHRSVGLAILFAQEASSKGYDVTICFRGKLKCKTMIFKN